LQFALKQGPEPERHLGPLGGILAGQIPFQPHRGGGPPRQLPGTRQVEPQVVQGHIFQGLLIPGRVEEVRGHQNIAGDPLEVRPEPLGQEQGGLQIRPHFGDARIGPHRAQLLPDGAV
jgi:hypothetical protein